MRTISRKTVAVAISVLLASTAFTVLPAGAVNDNSDDQLRVCVDWDTKNVMFSKYWEKCPSRTAELTLQRSNIVSQGVQMITGVGTPEDSVGDNGDYYFDVQTTSVYGPKTDSAWGESTTKTQTLASSNGFQFLKGTSNPTRSSGSVGDMFFNESSKELFGPKTSEGWGTGVSLRGPRGFSGGGGGGTGPQGPAGPQGPKGDTGATGPQGPAGADGADGATGPQGPAGPSGAAGNDGADGADGLTRVYVSTASGDKNLDLRLNADSRGPKTEILRISDVSPDDYLLRFSTQLAMDRGGKGELVHGVGCYAELGDSTSFESRGRFVTIGAPTTDFVTDDWTSGNEQYASMNVEFVLREADFSNSTDVVIHCQRIKTQDTSSLDQDPENLSTYAAIYSTDAELRLIEIADLVSE